MPTYRRTRRARQDLIEIWRHIARDDAAAADRLLDRIDESCARLAQSPAHGPARDDIRPGLRYFVVGAYLILYKATKEGVEIIRIVHGRSDLFHLL